MQQRTWLQKFLKFFSLFKYDKKNNILHIIQSIIRGLSPIIHIVFIERIVYAISKSNTQLLEETLWYYIIILFSFEWLWFLTRKWWWVVTLHQYEKQIYQTYLQAFIKMDNNAVEKVWTGKVIALLENGRLRWAEWLAATIERGIILLILLLYVFFTLWQHWIWFTFWFLILLFLSVVVLFYVNKFQFRYRKKRSEMRNERLRSITKILMSKNEILQSNKLEVDLKKIESYSVWMAQINIEMATGRTVQNRFIPFVVGLSIFAFTFLYSKYVLSWEMLLSEFVGITSIFLVINSSILNFTAFYIDLTKDFIDIEKLWDFFENTPEISGYDTGKNFQYIRWNFEIKNLTYWYEENKKIFENFSLQIEWWSILALVWNSGWGKTTLLKLLAWYIKPNDWEIFIDGQKLNEISLKSYYENIWYLTQDPSVFDGTILENLTYSLWNKTLSEIELQEVIQNAKCEFIYEFKDWVHTEIWERWIKLSGWQKQRLAIAKIMLKNPKIIFLDEPTSALDSFSEEQITKALHNLFENRTVIIVAHRLQTVKNASKILVIENGKILQEGNHEILSVQEGIYKKMLELQSGF